MDRSVQKRIDPRETVVAMLSILPAAPMGVVSGPLGPSQLIFDARRHLILPMKESPSEHRSSAVHDKS
jgi:hypothetical protein